MRRWLASIGAFGLTGLVLAGAPASANPCSQGVGLRTDWEVFDGGTTNGPSNWTISGASLVQTGNISGTSPTQPLLAPGTMAIRRGVAAADARVSVTVSTPKATGAVGIVMRFVDAKNYTRFSFDRVTLMARIVEVTAGTPRLLAQRALVATDLNAALSFSATTRDQMFEVTKNGMPFLAASDATPKPGRLGVYVQRIGSTATFAEWTVDCRDVPPPTPRTTWRVYQGSLEELLAEIGGFDVLATFSTAPRPFMVDLTDAKRAFAPAPVEFDGHLLRSHFAKHQYVPFTADSLTAILPGLKGANPLSETLGEWYALVDVSGAYGLVNIVGPIVQFATFAPMTIKQDGTTFSVSAPAPQSSIGVFLEQLYE